MRSVFEGGSMPIIFRVRNLIKPDQIQVEYKHSLALSNSLPPLNVYHFLSFHLPVPKVIFVCIYGYYELKMSSV